MNEAGMFVTMLYGVLDRLRGEFAYARAGHDVPLVCRPTREGGEILTPDQTIGQPLGILDAPKLDEQRLRVPIGGALVLYTDGALDARDPAGLFFGLERLQQAALVNLSDSAQGLCDHLLQGILTYQAGAPQDDDITLLAVRAS
jgi:sigma-B regulation protein RsbU (phosphoserine phosphatase)